MATAQTIGIVSAVVLSGLGYWYMSKDEEEETTTVTGGGVQTPPGPATPECSDDLGCLADTPHCNDDGACVSATEYFDSSTGSLYPAYGGSDLQKPDARKTIVGKEMCAKTCLDDPDCVGFTHWEERYDSDNPLIDGEEPTHPDSDLCYFWSGPQGDDLTLTPTAAVGESHEGDTDDVERANSKAVTYIKTEMKDYVPEVDDASTSAAENVENPFYKPTSSPTGSGYQISDKQSCVDWRQW
jgi:hypothetical protein